MVCPKIAVRVHAGERETLSYSTCSHTELLFITTLLLMLRRRSLLYVYYVLIFSTYVEPYFCDWHQSDQRQRNAPPPQLLQHQIKRITTQEKRRINKWRGGWRDSSTESVIDGPQVLRWMCAGGYYCYCRVWIQRTQRKDWTRTDVPSEHFLGDVTLPSLYSAPLTSPWTRTY